jgi:hypothetical protein
VLRGSFQRENLARLRRAVVDVDDRENVVVEAKP